LPEEKSSILKDITKGIAYEIKLPIVSIISSSNLLKKKIDKYITQEEQVYFNLIIKNSYQVLRYVEHTTNYLMLNEEQKEPIFKKENICDYILGLCISSEIFALSKKVMLSVNVPSEPIIMAFNFELLSSAILNLLSNAIKHSKKENSIKVSIINEKDFVYIEVSDNGIGIKKEELDKIFLPYYTNSSYSKEYSGGRGLGLFLVKGIAEMHKGKVEIKSEYGKGTSAIIKIPKNLKENTNHSIGNIIKQNELDFSRELKTIVNIELSDI